MSKILPVFFVSSANLLPSETPKIKPGALANFSAGAGGAAAAIYATTPLMRLVMKCQEGHQLSSAFAELGKEGFVPLYRGVSGPLAGRMLIFGGMYFVQSGTQERFGFVPSIFAAGCVKTGLGVVFERLYTLNSIRPGETPWSLAKMIYRQHGASELIRGVGAIGPRNLIDETSFFLYREMSRRYSSNKPEMIPTSLWSFGFGGLGAGITSFISYPFQTVKIRTELVVGGSFVNPITAISQIFQQEGLGALYKGASINMVRSIASRGVMTAVSEVILSYLDGNKKC